MKTIHKMTKPYKNHTKTIQQKPYKNHMTPSQMQTNHKKIIRNS